MPAMAVKASSYVDICFKCGDYNTTYEVLERWSVDTGETRYCIHGYEREADFKVEYYERVRYYCADCDVSWEQPEFVGMEWVCGHTDD